MYYLVGSRIVMFFSRKVLLFLRKFCFPFPLDAIWPVPETVMETVNCHSTGRHAIYYRGDYKEMVMKW